VSIPNYFIDTCIIFLPVPWAGF